MANILLGVTGSVAAVKVPELITALEFAGHAVRIAATETSFHFFDGEPLRRRGVLFRDADEWPPKAYQRGDEVLHVVLRKWADVLVVAPLDANTLAKFAGGLADNLLTCVYRCWDRAKPVVIAPAMNTLMWEHPATERHLVQVGADCPLLRTCWPQTKTLACGDTGTGAMADVAEIVSAANPAIPYN